MFLKTLILFMLALVAYAYPEETSATPAEVQSIPNRIEFLGSFTYQPRQVKEGDVLTLTFQPPKPENAEMANKLVKKIVIAIGTGEGNQVSEDYFMQSQPMPLPTAETTYKFQLPAQMENKDYCIAYIPYSDDAATTRSVHTNGELLECLYETWFPIQGSLAVGSGPKNAENTIQQQTTAGPEGVSREVDVSAAAPADQGNSTITQNAKSGSITISPAITAFIAILFACFFI